jgi:type II secretory pathway component GspD/PulD (secretin)
MRLIYLLLLSLSLSAAPLKPPPPLIGSITPTVSSMDQMSLTDFVRYASRSLKKNILVTGTLSGTIDFVSNETIPPKEILNLLRSALELNKYALVDHGSYFAVIPASDLSKYPSARLGSRSASGFSSKVIKINYLNAPSILEAVRFHLSPAGSAFGVPDNGALVVSDLPENIKQISSIVKNLDYKLELAPPAFKSFQLVNSSASSVIETIKGVFAIDNNNTALTLSFNEATNTIFALGDSSLVDRIPSIVSDLDREQYQVYIQVRIIELNNDLSNRIGLRYGLDGGIVSSSNFFTFSSNLGGSSVAPVDGLITSALTSSLGNVKQLLTIGAALDLLQSEGVSKTISDPSLLCLNNKDSKIVVGKSLSYLTGSTTGSAGTTNSLNRSDVGLNLNFKPLVANKEKLTLSIDAVLENVLPVLDANGQPMTSKQQIKTDAILHHGETIVLGGFVKSYESKNDNSVPFLSDIPLIGSVFKHDLSSKQSDTLLLVITPWIVDDSRTLSSLQNDLGSLGQIQKAYNDTIIKR